MAQTGTLIYEGQCELWQGIAGVNAADVMIETSDVSQFDTFELVNQAGAAEVLVSLDGTNFTSAPLSLTDFGATTTAPVIVTAANRLYGWRGKFKIVRVRQNGATGVTSCQLRVGRMS